MPKSSRAKLLNLTFPAARARVGSGLREGGAEPGGAQVPGTPGTLSRGEDRAGTRQVQPERSPRSAVLIFTDIRKGLFFFFKTKQDFSPIQVYLFKASANTKVLVMYIDLSGNLIPLYLKSPAGDSCREGCGGGADSPAPRAQRRTLEFLLNFIPGEKRSASLGLFEWEGRTRKASPRSGDWEAASSEVSARDLGGGGCGGI